jgi:hypothetical protein
VDVAQRDRQDDFRRLFAAKNFRRQSEAVVHQAKTEPRK